MKVHIDIHALQTVPYSNLNRDALGSPKNCLYGGKLRTRVSSQSWKRAIRLKLEEQLGEPTIRTRRIAEAVRDELQQRGWDSETARKAGRAVLVSADGAAKRSSKKEGGIMPDGGTDQSKVLFWIPNGAINDLADLCERYREEIAATDLPPEEETEQQNNKKKSANSKPPKPDIVVPSEEVDSLLRKRSASINLLGRMLAEIPEHNVDGATQFAHAFTTHESTTDFDFFTAVDDRVGNGVQEESGSTETGTGHLATAEFTSGVFYRYSSVNVTDLASNLSGKSQPTPEDTDQALSVLDTYLRAFCNAMPSGKRRTTAASTPPELVYLTVRRNPLSLAGAFEKPVTAERDGGYAETSRVRLNTYTDRLYRFLGTDELLWHGHAGLNDSPLNALGERDESLHDLITNGINQAGDHA
ncbi:hypothetical protein IL38_22080 [Actinopolyspora erythraea]|uniref:Type I-E CRISPR-associated protein Cas7/Cse4/CasC n=1 Tax=Actinopolyspora erythraea TaxID=414996 RepID=A0ABR4WZ25_9ACTN|nr:hypothetical protein IL38_22080 [Actinopolyspora erythraea]